MKTHTTNYFDTFIQAAADFKGDESMRPVAKEKKTVAQMQYDLIANDPYHYTSDEVLFKIHAERNGITLSQEKQARTDFFSKGQACLRASPLTKNYGFGIHANAQGRVALYGIETDTYQKMVDDPHITQVKAMKSKR